MKLTLVLHNIRSVYNVGAILRTAEGLGVESVVFSGYTPRYHDPKALPHLREKLDRQIAKSALGAEEMVPLILVDDLPAWLEQQKAAGGIILGLENNLDPKDEKRKLILGQGETNCSLSGAFATYESQLERPLARDDGTSEASPEKSNLFPFAKEPDLFLILGEEVHGIPAEIRRLCDFFLEIPMVGRKESFNVSVATAIATWEIMKPSARR